MGSGGYQKGDIFNEEMKFNFHLVTHQKCLIKDFTILVKHVSGILPFSPLVYYKTLFINLI